MDGDMTDLLKLQEIFLAQEIERQLADRDISEHGLANQFIDCVKLVQSQEEFITAIEQKGISISKHFLASLYNKIKQGLASAINVHDQDMEDEDSVENKEEQLRVKAQRMKQEAAQKQIKEEQEEKKPTQKYFPGLTIPNKDQIELQLDIDFGEDQQKEDKQVQINKESPPRKKKIVERLKEMHSQGEKNRQKQKSRSRSRSREKNKKNKDHYQSRRRSQSQDSYRKHKKKKEKKQKKEKQSKKRKHRQRSQEKQERKKSVQKKVYRKVAEGEVFKGRVSRVDKFGCFVQLYDTENMTRGLVHVSEMRDNFVADPHDVVKEGDRVWVRILTILQDRIRLTMKGIDQRSGRVRGQLSADNSRNDGPGLSKNASNPGDKDYGQLTGIKIEHKDEVDMEGNAASHGDLWQMSRMSYMPGVTNSRTLIRQQIEQINIEMNERQPPFLRGQTTKAGINLSPVRVVKNPQGTLQRQALNALQYAKQRRQIREQQSKADNNLAKILDQITPKHDFKKQIKRTSQTIKDQRSNLPVFALKQQLVKACMDNKVLIVIGETGSGKTTQITQYLHEAGFSKNGKIGCTQPRRVAAMSVAKRVCQEMNVKLGQQVGYSIRFEDVTSSKTIIKYMTDGMLLRQALVDKYLSAYSVIMLDEAHERTIHTDVLFGILKKVVEKRNDFTLIVTSATLEARKFSTYFFDCKIFSIPGRTYNVQILYAKEPQSDYLDAALMCVMQIHLDQPPGDILLFLTGQEQIDTSCQILRERLRKMGNQIPELIILPVYSALPSQLQTKIFDPAPKGKRKCVIATNIAEASLTIDGIFYVVDPGFAKVKIYNSKLGMDSLIVAPISQASAKQRAGRAGRTGPGKCYRIYTEDAYKNQMLPTSVPQIQRANLSNTVLELKAMGINDLINFDFMDAPPVQTLIAALEQLYYLSALDDEGLLTRLGRKMAQFPLQPPLSKMLLTSIDFNCSDQIITIIAMLSIPNIFYRPKEKEVLADQKKTKFNHHEGDHLTFLSVYEAWKKSGYSSSWCQQNFIQYRGLKRAQDVRNQIIDLLERYRFKLSSCGGNSAMIRKTIVSGFFFHAAKKDQKGGYRTLVDDHQVYIHPSSSLFNKQPEWVVYHQLIFTSKQYMRNVCAINPKWLIDVAPNFFKFTDEVGFVRKKRNEKLDPLIQKYGDPNAWRLSKRKG